MTADNDNSSSSNKNDEASAFLLLMTWLFIRLQMKTASMSRGYCEMTEYAVAGSKPVQ
jgi:hypothetical protein